MWVSHFISLTYILMQTYNLQLFVLADWICLFLRLSSDQIQFYDQNSTFSSSCTQTSNIVSAFQINTSALNEIWFLQPDIQMKAELLLDIFGTSMRENIPTSEDVRWTMTALLCGILVWDSILPHEDKPNPNTTQPELMSTWMPV